MSKNDGVLIFTGPHASEVDARAADAANSPHE
jgi:hypothetical protein